MIHKEGSTTLTYLLITLSTVNVLAAVMSPIRWIPIVMVSLSCLFFALMIYFFRNPSRITVENPQHIIAPVDGKVVAIEEVYEREYFKDKRLQISIFMSPLNVHVTRHPVSGRVRYNRYHPGKFLMAWLPKSSELNERTTVVVENSTFGAVLYRQIAGALARRIVNYPQEGTYVEQGSDSGFIKFGSRVDVFLPPDTKVNVKLKERTRGGETVIAEI